MHLLQHELQGAVGGFDGWISTVAHRAAQIKKARRGSTRRAKGRKHEKQTSFATQMQ
jgi:hypothetical protein